MFCLVKLRGERLFPPQKHIFRQTKQPANQDPSSQQTRRKPLPNLQLGDFLFTHEALHCCSHSSNPLGDSEVAWVYQLPAQPRRWVSKPRADGTRDETNRSGPWETVDVALNKWGESGGTTGMVFDSKFGDVHTVIFLGRTVISLLARNC